MRAQDKALALALAITIATGTLVSRQAQAIVAQSGSHCVPNVGVQVGNFSYSYVVAGAANASSSQADLTCPISLGNSTSTCMPVSSVTVRYSDKNPALSFACKIYQFGFDGLLLYYGPPRYTCSVNGGCPDATSQFVGNGYLSLVPTGSATNNCMDQDYGVLCFLPPKATSASSS